MFSILTVQNLDIILYHTILFEHKWSKQCVWIATHHSGKQCNCIYTLTFPASCLLGQCPQTPLNTEVPSVAARPSDANRDSPRLYQTMGQIFVP